MVTKFSGSSSHEYQLVDMASSLEKKVLDETSSDDDVLAQLGYTQGEHATTPRLPNTMEDDL
jgi:hypothetical protein